MPIQQILKSTNQKAATAAGRVNYFDFGISFGVFPSISFPTVFLTM